MNKAYRDPTPSNLDSVAEILLKSPRFTTFWRCLTTVGLDTTLRDEREFTVFAPTDEAFANMPPEVFEGLMGDRPRLRSVVEYHIVNGACDLRVIRQGKLRTMQGTTLSIGATDDGLTVDHANISGRLIPCGNGMLQAIDAVLMPGYVRAQSPAALAESAWSGKRRPRPGNPRR